MTLAAVVPAYNPGSAVKAVLPEVARQVDRVVLVDDGSDAGEAGVLRELAVRTGATHIRFAGNRGKGHALAEGIRQALADGADFVLTLDSDGQHAPSDIPGFRALAERLDPGANHLGLGTRTVSAMPPRSRLGNALCARLFAFLTGRWVADTQTGYRLLSRAFAERFLASCPPGRFETEMRMLVLAAASGCAMHHVPVRTLYFDNNANSKFRPLVDTLRVLGPLRRQLAVAVASFAVDYSAFLALCALLGPTRYLAAHGLARTVSAGLSFFAGRTCTWHTRLDVAREARRYVPALLLSTLGSGLLLALLVGTLRVPVAPAKLLAETLLFGLKFFERKERMKQAMIVVAALLTVCPCYAGDAKPPEGAEGFVRQIVRSLLEGENAITFAVADQVFAIDNGEKLSRDELKEAWPELGRQALTRKVPADEFFRNVEVRLSAARENKRLLSNTRLMEVYKPEDGDLYCDVSQAREGGEKLVAYDKAFFYIIRQVDGRWTLIGMGG